MTTTAPLPVPTPDGGDGPSALRHLDAFAAVALPAAFRKMACWKGLRPDRHGDLAQDLHQELVLDCLEHGSVIEGLEPRARHARWLRLLERTLYRLHLRSQRWVDDEIEPQQVAVSEDAASGGELTALAHLPGTDAAAACELLESSLHLGNGRINVAATGRQVGLSPRQVRRMWQCIAERLGYDDQYLSFWRRRLVEALVGLAADLLRDAGTVRVHRERSRARPDPAGRLRRIRRIQGMLRLRPLPAELRAVVARFPRWRSLRNANACDLLACAGALAPENAAVALWQFEAAVVADRYGAAARALRRARRAGGDPVRVVLARARLLEARGLERRALRLLSRALQRQCGDGRILEAMRDLS